MSLIGYALRMAKQYYESKTYDHVLRVAGYVAENPMIPDDKMDNCVALAIMHDLIEDTEYTGGCFGAEYKHFEECLNLLTKSKNTNYIEYVKKIRDYSDTRPEVYWVKLADMKDHLTQTETLTDKLKEKYLAALPYLL
ncbi:hypothetical protein NSB25_20960 [Acetatifactor muris]|nr:HD domain-containing protein [Acetatifactor muris]MCR2049729.1 hypothetical protein [Acetatifactor muris]